METDVPQREALEHNDLAEPSSAKEHHRRSMEPSTRREGTAVQETHLRRPAKWNLALETEPRRRERRHNATTTLTGKSQTKGFHPETMVEEDTCGDTSKKGNGAQERRCHWRRHNRAEPSLRTLPPPPKSICHNKTVRESDASGTERRWI